MKVTIYYFVVFAVMTILYLGLQKAWEEKRVLLTFFLSIALLIVLLLFL